jgi:hypothetical protein
VALQVHPSPVALQRNLAALLKAVLKGQNVAHLDNITLTTHCRDVFNYFRLEIINEAQHLSKPVEELTQFHLDHLHMQFQLA